MISKEIQERLRNKYNPEGSTLRKAQHRMLELLVFLDKVCTEHNLTYWLDGGTLLGAMRHGGFIPWDDDTDVCMPREDALRLKEILKDDIHEGHIILHDRSTDPNYQNSSWMTLRDLKSRYIQDDYAHNRQKYQGLQVDIFVMEKNVPAWIKKISSMAHWTLIYNPLAGSHHLKFLRPFVGLSHTVLDSAVYPLLRKIKKTDGRITYGIGTPFKDRYEESDIYPTGKISFEGVELNSPHNPDNYLKTLYGDWKHIPDGDEIKIHTDQIEVSPLE